MSINYSVKQKTIEDTMMALMAELAKLAPKSKKSQTANDTEFVKLESYLEPSAEYDTILEEVIVESFLGCNFASVASGVNWDQAAEDINAYTQECSEAQAMPSPPALGHKNIISASFNRGSKEIATLDAHLRDLPKRLGIERFISEYQRKLYALRKHALLTLAA